MIRPILQLGDRRLREVSIPVDLANATFGDLCQDLRDTLGDVMTRHEFRKCAGLSAVQIGTLRRACLVWLPGEGFRFLANPVVLAESPETAVEFEGCLSFFGQRGCVPRSEWVRVGYVDESLAAVEREFRNWGARIVLHEIDHMDGILYPDRMRSWDDLLDYQDYLRATAGRWPSPEIPHSPVGPAEVRT